jgi:phosphoribosylanthranilate isomerase
MVEEVWQMTRVKVCGLMNEKDIAVCADEGVHTFGFVVDYPEPVPWNLSVDDAKSLIGRVPPYTCTCVVTGGSVGKVIDTVLKIRPAMLQLHHKETPEEVSYIAKRLSTEGIKTVKALRIRADGLCDSGAGDPAEAARILAGTGISGILVDSFTNSMPGGTGVPVDLRAFFKVRNSTHLPVILAGGLNPENIADVVRTAAPFAVDVLTGVERRPGYKDENKIKMFMQEIIRR